MSTHVEREIPQEHPVELAALRSEIEKVDEHILSLIEVRCRLAQEAGERKRAAGIATLDPAQEAVVIRRAAVRARDAKLDEEVVRQLFWCLIGLSRSTQEKHRAGGCQ
jgi:chorismate mutase